MMKIKCVNFNFFWEELSFILCRVMFIGFLVFLTSCQDGNIYEEQYEKNQKQYNFEYGKDLFDQEFYTILLDDEDFLKCCNAFCRSGQIRNNFSCKNYVNLRMNALKKCQSLLKELKIKYSYNYFSKYIHRYYLENYLGTRLDNKMVNGANGGTLPDIYVSGAGGLSSAYREVYEVLMEIDNHYHLHGQTRLNIIASMWWPYNKLGYKFFNYNYKASDYLIASWCDGIGIDKYERTSTVVRIPEFYIMAAEEMGLINQYPDDSDHDSGHDSGHDSDNDSGSTNPSKPPKIFETDSVIKHEYLSCVWSRIKALDALKGILDKFKGGSPIVNINLGISETMDMRYRGLAHAPCKSTINIDINANLLYKMTDIEVVQCIAHELVHADIYRKLLSIGEKDGRLDLKKIKKAFESGDYPLLYKYYCDYGPHTFQHEYMGTEAISLIMDAIGEYDPSVPPFIAEAFAWHGLYYTHTWRDFDQRKKNRFARIIQQFKQLILDKNNNKLHICR